MRSPEMAIFRKEVGALFSARSTLSLWVLSSFLIGYGFIQAVDLYSEASRAALAHKELASGMNSFEGILVPTEELNLISHQNLPQWNYTISPNKMGSYCYALPKAFKPNLIAAFL